MSTKKFQIETTFRGADIVARVIAAQERRAAIQTLKWAQTLGDLSAEPREPTEDEIQAFIVAMREDPRVVPSFDPEDP